MGCVLTILKNDGVRQWGWDYPMYEMEKNVTNHQADMVCLSLQVFEHREYLGIVSRPGQGSPASTGS